VKLLKGDGTANWQTVSLRGGRYNFEPVPVQDGESWVLLFHRALMQQQNVDWTKKSAYSPGNSESVLGYLTGRSVDTHSTTTGFNDGNMEMMADALKANKAVCVLTNPGAYGSYNMLGTISTKKLVNFHWYSVESIDMDARTITLRNPWHKDGGEQPEGEVTKDGLVTISFDEFYGSFKKYCMS
jgi:hypothetical protein